MQIKNSSFGIKKMLLANVYVPLILVMTSHSQWEGVWVCHFFDTRQNMYDVFYSDRGKGGQNIFKFVWRNLSTAPKCAFGPYTRFKRFTSGCRKKYNYRFSTHHPTSSSHHPASSSHYSWCLKILIFFEENFLLCVPFWALKFNWTDLTS